MLRGKKVVGIIPVRGGSKGLPGKNLYKINGQSLLERTILRSLGCGYIDQTIVSTDDEKMYGIAEKYGVHSKHLRPTNLATSTASTIDVIEHVCREMELDDVYVALLQVTTPLCTLADLNAAFELFDENMWADSVVSLKKHDAPHPDKIQSIEAGRVVSYLKKESMVARQLLPEVYSLNGAFYLAAKNQILDRRSFFSENTLPYVMPEIRSINLDGFYDKVMLEALIEKGIVEPEKLEATAFK